MACQTEFLNIVKGDDVQFDIQFVKEDENGVLVAQDLTGYTVEVVMPSQTGSLTKAAVVTDAAAGKAQVTLTQSESETLKRGERQTFYATITETSTSEETTAKFKDQLNVEDRDFR